MARLIDAKELERQVKEALKDDNPVLMGLMLRWIRKQKTVDAVPVVRCKDCRYYNEDGEYCGNWGECRHPEHFCDEGERKDNEIDY